MSQQKFHADPDELESMAGELEPLPEQLVGEARARLTQVERAASANPGWFSSTAMSYACQQLRLQFEAAAKNVTGYAAVERGELPVGGLGGRQASPADPGEHLICRGTSRSSAGSRASS